LEFQYVDDKAIFWIGGVHALGKQIADERKILARSQRDPEMEPSLRASLDALEASQAVEDGLVAIMTSPDVEGVGGILSKMELFNSQPETQVAFSSDDATSFFHGMPSVSSSAYVGPIPIVGKLGS
jgi:hypothetical protein